MNNPNILKILADLKSNLPDSTANILQVREKFSDFYKKYQTQLSVSLDHFLINTINAYWVSDTSCHSDKVILFFHGGGFSIGSTEDHLEIIARLVKTTQHKVLSIDYSLAPEHLYPAAVNDCLNAYKWLLAQGYLPHNIILCGISAGANLALASLLTIKKYTWPQPYACIAISCAPDVSLTVPSFTYNAPYDWITQERIVSINKTYLPDQHYAVDPEVTLLRGDFSGCAPILLQAGDSEILFDQIILFFQILRKQKINVNLEVYPDMVHCWQLFSKVLSEGQRSIDQIKQFIQTVNCK